MRFNANAVFSGANEQSYSNAIAVPTTTQIALAGARDIIRNALRAGLARWAELASGSELFEIGVLDASTTRLSPRFRLQGSFAYHTQVEPAWVPPQEIDLDDGLFLPVPFVDRNGLLGPAIASTALFKAVEEILRPICKSNGWILITSKPSCVRVQLSEKLHADLALYAIPDGEFGQLVESMVRLQPVILQDGYRQRVSEDNEIEPGVYRGLGVDHLLLAHRVEGWKPSDPRKLETWFLGAVGTHGEQLRRVTRYLKGWRDYVWPSCQLRSIVIMAGVVDLYGKGGRWPQRDDLAVLSVAGSLSKFLARRIPNPVVDGQFLDEGWSREERDEFVAKAAELERFMIAAIGGSASREASIASLQRAFGDRIPETPDLLVLDEPANQAAASVAAPLIILTEAEKVRRAAAALGAVHDRGTTSKPWLP